MKCIKIFENQIKIENNLARLYTKSVNNRKWFIYEKSGYHLVTESTATAAYIPHKLTDDIFDQLMGEKKIFTIGNIKYEKVQYTYTPSLEHRFINFYPIYSEIELSFDVTEESTAKMHEKNKDYAHWKIHFCATFNEEHGYQCIAVFQVLVPTMTLEPNDVVTQQWTILREMN